MGQENCLSPLSDSPFSWTTIKFLLSFIFCKQNEPCSSNVSFRCDLQLKNLGSSSLSPLQPSGVCQKYANGVLHDFSSGQWLDYVMKIFRAICNVVLAFYAVDRASLQTQSELVRYRLLLSRLTHTLSNLCLLTFCKVSSLKCVM